MSQTDLNISNSNASSTLLKSIRQSWKTFATFALVGGAAAILISFLIPEKYLATGIVSQSTFGGQEVEALNTLIEKMRLVTFYSEPTVATCHSKDNPERLVNKINPSATRDGRAILIGIKLESREAAIDCLNAVVKDINAEQLPIYQSRINGGREILDTLRREYALLLSDKAQELAVDRVRLDAFKDKLTGIESFISNVKGKDLSFNFKDEQFSAMSLFLTTLLSKETEAQDLRVGIRQLSEKLDTKSSDFDNKIVSKEAEIIIAQRNLEEPQTSPAKFAVPIAASNDPVQPLRGLIALIGLMLGAVLGWLYVSFRSHSYRTSIE